MEAPECLDVAFDCVMPMLIEAGFIVRPRLGVYQMVKQEKYTDVAKTSILSLLPE